MLHSCFFARSAGGAVKTSPPSDVDVELSDMRNELSHVRYKEETEGEKGKTA